VSKMYEELATWWPLLSPPEEYEDEVRFFLKVLDGAGLPPAPSLLELGCGGGNNALYLKPHFAQLTLTDLAPGMLALSRELNPECEHVLGDMRTLRLGRSFDVVFVHDAIMYMTTPAELRQAMETAAVHCRPGGVALFVPDYVRESFQVSSDHGGTDGAGRGMRYLEWVYDPDEGDTTYITEYVYMLREGAGPATVEHELHVEGLFARAEWLSLLEEVGLQAHVISDPFEREIFLARRVV
jgi:SAM-dependent methyltransferase